MSAGADYDDYDYDEHGGCVCPNCMGMRSVNCYCGGDLCVCENCGEKDCPTCWGEGEVSQEVYDKYLTCVREMAQALAGALAKIDAEKTN